MAARPDSAKFLPPRPDSAQSVHSVEHDDPTGTFFRAHFESILKPFAENVEELYQTVLKLSQDMHEFQTKTESNHGSLQQHAARLESLGNLQETLLGKSEATSKKLQSTIDNALTTEKAMSVRLEKLEGYAFTMHGEIQELQKNGKDTSTKLSVLEDTQDKHRLYNAQLDAEIRRLAFNLEDTTQAHATTVDNVNKNKLLLDSTAISIDRLEQEQREVSDRFDILNKHCTDKIKMLDSKYSELQKQALQSQGEAQKIIDAAKFDKQKILDKQNAINEEMAKVSKRIDVELGELSTRMDATTLRTDELLRSQGEKQKEDMTNVRRNLDDLEAMTSKQEKELATLQSSIGVLPGRVKELEKEAEFNNKRIPRCEKALGLEPMTKDSADPRKLKKRASTAMLGEDQLLRKAWAAWMEFRVEAKNDALAEALPKIQEMIKVHNNMIESEKSKLHSTSDLVQRLQEDNANLKEDLQKLRKKLDHNDGYWKGMSRGLQATQKTVQTHLNGLPPLASSARPHTSQS